MALRIAAICLIVVCRSLSAHETGPLHPDDAWSAWAFTPGVLIPILISSVLYLRGTRPSRGVTGTRFACFWGGIAALVVALVSPLHPLGEVLFTAHMTQHEVLMVIAAPLLVISRPVAPLLRGMPLRWRRIAGDWSKAKWFRRGWHHLTAPFSAWWLHAVVLWCWHFPALFEATLRSEWVHSAQHLSFFLSALLFWWSLMYAGGGRGYGAAVLYIFTTAVHTGILGALLAFSPVVLYPSYAATAPLWGLTALQDQQIGGLIMWVPASVVYTVAGLLMLGAWLRESDVPALGRGQYAD